MEKQRLVNAEPIDQEYYLKLKMLRALQLDDYIAAEEYVEELAEDIKIHNVEVIKKINEMLPEEIEEQEKMEEEYELQPEESESSSEFDSEASESEPDSDMTPEEAEKFIQEQKENRE